MIPTLTDPSVAPPGKHVMSCFVQYAPYHLRGGTWDEQREAFGDTVVDTLAEYAPNIRDIILHRQVLTPLDLEREFGLTEGNIFQGELTLEQLFFLRPRRAGRSTGRRSAACTCAARHASRRRHHGRAGTERRARDPRETPVDERRAASRHRRRPNGLVGGVRARARPASGPLVLERRDAVGGAAATRELVPGVRVPRLAHAIGPIRADVAGVDGPRRPRACGSWSRRSRA